MVSAIARANEQLVAAERLATIGKMAAHVTHEIRNPLSSIALNLELLEEDLANAGPEAQALLKAIGKEVDRLSALSGQYLAFARRQPLRFESEDVGEIVREAVDFVRREFAQHKVEITLRVEPELSRVNADEGQLKQAIFNLLRNAREAMPTGGEVTVSVVGAVGGGVDVTIDDEGVGIDEERARGSSSRFSRRSHTARASGSRSPARSSRSTREHRVRTASRRPRYEDLASFAGGSATGSAECRLACGRRGRPGRRLWLAERGKRAERDERGKQQTRPEGATS